MEACNFTHVSLQWELSRESSAGLVPLGLYAVGPLQYNYGWRTVWDFLIACAIAGVVLLLPKVRKEIFQEDINFDHVARLRSDTSAASSLLPPTGSGEKQSQQCNGCNYGAISSNSYR